MKIALVQTSPVWEAPAANLAAAERWVGEAEADLVVFCEMFTTGFTMNAATAAETMQGKGPAALREMARRHGKAIMGSMAIGEVEAEVGDAAHVQVVVFCDLYHKRFGGVFTP